MTDNDRRKDFLLSVAIAAIMVLVLVAEFAP